ncbi:hypothetical protein F5J12DRAFT_763443 [Pisolithus orientalis]|uniref:uncharacterized protein n=1 Tax=Pisolithus orientalis TaxID=936130 RepID=UPI0022242E2A|nr:uncharacterized protein F5J12DRAFT_763443 [Pisolithus orientalis]KAI6028572.1 hypothetical protein F5J12DRAFT_763443 [Pisolithus orientalis]
MHSSRHTRASSPPLSTTGSSQVTTTHQPKLNVVTRLAIEGKARHGEDGASIRMYLKVNIPLCPSLWTSVSSGSTIPLFAEENLKLLSAQVHPLDANSTPYNFSSSAFPMLNNAARALNLPARSSKSYLSLFGVSVSTTSVHSSRSSSSTSTSTSSPPLDDRYTGHIIVSGYNISYILPKDFPPRFVGDDSALRVSTFSAVKMRRGSVSERSNMHFMAAIDLFVPFTSRPPQAPFLISLPLPRCLSNNVKLRIFPASTTNMSASMASLSSAEEDPGSWELTSEPHVTRTTTRASRSGSYGNIADDESSDSSYAEGASGGIIVRGTFPSTDRLRVRWAPPTKTLTVNGDSRRRVGVKEAKGETSVFVLGKAQDPQSEREGILMKVEYKGTCKGVWFPGVATMLGMDVGLNAPGSDVVWAPGEEAKWSVSGGVGYTGFDVGPPSTPVSRQPSLDFPSSSGMLHAPSMAVRSSSSSSMSSLLRAPLPADQLPDYSFEGSPTSLTPSVTLSSISSVPLTSEGRSRASSNAQPPRPPAVPITIHINMNEIIPPAKNVFAFTISGTILVVPKTPSRSVNEHRPNFSSSSEDEATVPIVLPRFSVLAADSESTSTIIRNETDNATVEVYNIAGDLRDAQTRRTVLQRNSITRCGSDGGRIALRPIVQLSVPRSNRTELSLDSSRLSPRPRTSIGPKELVARSSSAVHPQAMLMRRQRNGPLMIPAVDITVTPLCLGNSKLPNAHAVRLCVHAPPDGDSDWLEFGLAREAGSTTSSGTRSTDAADHPEIDVEIVSVSVDDVPIRFENRLQGKKEATPTIDFGNTLTENHRSDWITWVRCQVGEQGGRLLVDYVVKPHADQKFTTHMTKGKAQVIDKSRVNILVPTFTLPIGRMDVTIDSVTYIDSLDSNFAYHRQTPEGYRLLHYSLEEFFCPKVTLVLHSGASRVGTGRFHLRKFVLALGILPVVILFMLLSNLGSEFRLMRQSFDLLATQSNSAWQQFPTPITETVFVTTTIFTSQGPSSGHPSPTPTTSSAQAVTPIHVVSYDGTVIPPSSRPVERNTPTLVKGAPEPSDPSLDSRGSSLLPVNVLPFNWPLPPDLIPTAQRSWEKLVGGLTVVWQVFRTVYHYPLDPP